MSEGCEICSRPVEVEFHATLFDGMLKASTCFDCFAQGDGVVIRGVVKARWKRVLAIFGLTDEALDALGDETGRLPEAIREPIWKFICSGDEGVLDGVKVQAVD